MLLSPPLPAAARDAEVALFDTLDAVAVDAGGALDRAAQPRLYDRLDWHRRVGAFALAPGRPLVARASLGAARGWLFLSASGSSAQAHGCWYTLSFGPAFAQAADDATRTALIAAVARALRMRLGHITLSPVAEADRALLAAGFAAAGWRVTSEIISQNWIAHTEGEDFATYWARRPSRLRNTARRKAKGAPFAITLFDHFDPTVWSPYEAVYARSWKPAEGSPGFVRAMAEAEGAAGCLRMGLATRDRRPVAAQLWTVEHGHATIHKLAYDEAERAASPGTILSEAMFAHVIGRDRPALIDFGTGDDGYKADWMDEKRPLHTVTCANPRHAAGLARIGRDWVKALRR